jgi:hypothetical protein
MPLHDTANYITTIMSSSGLGPVRPVPLDREDALGLTAVGDTTLNVASDVFMPKTRQKPNSSASRRPKRNNSEDTYGN